jgi:hypothetical protein
MNTKLHGGSLRSSQYLIHDTNIDKLFKKPNQWISTNIKRVVRTSVKQNKKPINSILNCKMNFFNKMMSDPILGDFCFVIYNNIISFEFHNLIKTEKNPHECCVCYEDNLFKLDCRHSVCLSCWCQMYIRSQTNCPYCRSEMSYNRNFNIHKIPIKSILSILSGLKGIIR